MNCVDFTPKIKPDMTSTYVLQCQTQCGISQICLSGTPDGDAWCNGYHVCFPSLPPMLLSGFESRLGLESSGRIVVAFSEARRQGFSPGTPVSSPPTSV